jgi:hypothetical protein
MRKSRDRYVAAGRRSSATRRSGRRKAAPVKSTPAPRGCDIVQRRDWAGANNVVVPPEDGSLSTRWTRTNKQVAGDELTAVTGEQPCSFPACER